MAKQNILIADSGSSKTNWVYIDANQNKYPFYSAGINPLIGDNLSHSAILTEIFKQIPGAIISLYFYGAGLGQASTQSDFKSHIQSLLPSTRIFTHSDLLAAGRASCSGKPGIICILGTGSNSAYCDGHTITQELPALGYLLGDESSGNYFGKILLRDYFYKQMPEDLRTKFEQQFPELLENFIPQLYKHQKPNAFLATFGRFMVQHKTNPYCKLYIQNGIEQFIQYRIQNHTNYTTLPIHFVGGIAAQLTEELKVIFDKYALHLGNIIDKPIQSLVDYHLTYDKD